MRVVRVQKGARRADPCSLRMVSTRSSAAMSIALIVSLRLCDSLFANTVSGQYSANMRCSSLLMMLIMLLLLLFGATAKATARASDSSPAIRNRMPADRNGEAVDSELFARYRAQHHAGFRHGHALAALLADRSRNRTDDARDRPTHASLAHAVLVRLVPLLGLAAFAYAVRERWSAAALAEQSHHAMLRRVRRTEV